MAKSARLILVARAGPLADGLQGLLATIPGVEIVGPVDGLLPVLATMSQPGPATVLLDSGSFAKQCPTMVRQLRAVLPGIKFMVLADDVSQQRAAENAGADIVLLKGCRPAELVAAVRDLLLAQAAPPLE